LAMAGLVFVQRKRVGGRKKDLDKKGGSKKVSKDVSEIPADVGRR